MSGPHTAVAAKVVQPIVPETLNFDRWTGAYVGLYNDLWVSQRFERKLWTVAFRDRGNVSKVISRHRNLGRALASANRFALAHGAA